MNISDITEAMENSTKDSSMTALEEKYRQYYNGEETMSVLQMYMDAAIAAGNSYSDVMLLQRKVKGI